MKTADEVRVCPYTGLRSFTEDESLYFKGRDQQVDQITRLLELNKFLMVTGASGEGKSSLIYAGLIPNARAGFFKAKYSNWVVADFRPERNPVANMAHALAAQFDSQPESIETEIRRGYSSLVDLYTNSSFYIEEDESNNEQFTDQQNKDRKRKAANLLIIADQFEEFFTNPENFYNETLSKDSQIVVNLILETARIALRRNLPVYVICTMRSDYIGQCSAFRGLPEYIGFSQFFVPRLKRKDLKQVIEEPALLSGIRISQRLIERLVFDIAEGVDQLPILQHALSRIWNAASQGNEELDLIHYAMVGGMPAEELPDEDLHRFQIWFAALPEAHQKFYAQTGLSKIIEIHANLLYENAWEYYNTRHPEHTISQQQAKRIVAISFSCLTKIDNSRAVRNRMSLEEITGIINQPGLNWETVGGVLNIFREEGNSFVRPFKTEDPASAKLFPGTVLDITHESLIRNWNKLNQWANKEFEFYSTFLDFKKQLDRWKKSGKSRNYLLPAGPLSYFENWYENCKPNSGWITRYAEAREDPKEAQQHAEETLRDTQSFLKRSARKEFVTRSFMKYGPQRIAAVFAIAVMLILSGFYWYNADQKKNIHVIERVKEQGAVFLKSSDVNVNEKALYLLVLERHDTGSLIKYLASLPFDERIKLGNEIYKQIMGFSKNQEFPLKSNVRQLVSENLLSSQGSNDPEFMLTETNKFLLLLEMDQYYEPDPDKQNVLETLSSKNEGLVLKFYQNTNLYHPAVPVELNMALQLWLTIGKATGGEIQDLLKAISPLENPNAEKSFNVYYMKGSFETDGRLQLDFNGGYHNLSCLYAALGDVQKIELCFQKILENNEHNYFELPRTLNNHLNVLEYLYQYGHRNQVPAFLNWIAKNTEDNKPATVLRNAVVRSGYISHMYDIDIHRNYYRSTRGFLYPNLCLSNRSVFDALTDDYDSVTNEIKDPSDRNFKMALNQKRKAVFYSKYWYDRKMVVDEKKLNQWFDHSFDFYHKVDSSFLEGTESSTLVYNGDGVRTSDVKRRELMIYPDYRDGWFAWSYHSDYFFNYLWKKDLLKSLYKTGEDLQVLHYWVAKAYELKTEVSPWVYSNAYPLPDSALKKIIAFTDHHPANGSFDKNLLFLILANHAFDSGDTTQGLSYYHQINTASLGRSAIRYEYLELIFFLNSMKSLCIHLAAIGKIDESVQLIKQFPRDDMRIFSYVQIADTLYNQNANPLSFVLLDSVMTINKRLDYSDRFGLLDSRNGQIKVLSEIGSDHLNKIADGLLRDITEDGKFDGISSRVDGIAVEGNYYRAWSSIPTTLTESQDLYCRTLILYEDCRAKEKTGGGSDWTNFDKSSNWTDYYTNFNPN